MLLAVLCEGLGGLEVAPAGGAGVNAVRQRPGAVPGGASDAAEGVEVVDEDVALPTAAGGSRARARWAWDRP